MDTNSIWQNSKSIPFQVLKNNENCEVCIVGAGIAGSSIAYELLQQGKSIIILDRDYSMKSETALTSAHLSNALDDGYASIERLLGLKSAKIAAKSHTEAIKRIEKTIKQEGIACEFRWLKGYLVTGKTDNKKVLLEEFKAAKKSGIPNLKIVNHVPLLPSLTAHALVFSDQAEFHPLKYLSGLHKSILSMGGKIYGGAAVIKTNEQPDNVLVETDSGFTVSCKNLVFATNAPSNHQIKIHTKEAAYRSYMIGLKIKKDIFPKILLWDTEDPYHYVRVQSEKDHDVILIGGCDHRVGQEDASKDYFEELKFWAQDRLGMSGEMIYKWSGQIIETLDGLAYIGKSPGSTNTYEVSGDSGHGLTHGTIAGIIISDLILGNHNSWIELYNPARKNIHSIVTFVKENIQGVSQNIDWITPGDVKSEADMPNDSGAIIRDGIEKIAVYKDASGNLHKCSAVCPHLGALVRWNHLEKTWDCPFHGSRFSIDGEVLNGPTNDGLELVNKNKIR